MAFCSNCGAQIGEGNSFCASCGTSVGSAAPAPAPAAQVGSAGGLAPNVAGALAYITIIPAILFLVMDPYNKDKFIKFHSLQCVFFSLALFVMAIVLMIVGFILAFIPVVGWFLDVLLWAIFWLGSLVVGIFLIYKAYSGQKFMLPVIGKIAEQQASR